MLTTCAPNTAFVRLFHTHTNIYDIFTDIHTVVWLLPCTICILRQSTFWFYINLQIVVRPTTNEEQNYSAAQLARGWENAGTIARVINSRTQQPVSTGQFLHYYLARSTRLPTTTHYRLTLLPQVNTYHLISARDSICNCFYSQIVWNHRDNKPPVTQESI